MGWFDAANGQGGNPQTEPDGAMAERVGALVDQLLGIGIDGQGTFASAHTVADAATRRRSSTERAIDDLVGQHVRLAATTGFVTGLGGFIVMTVALPANVAGFYIIAARMAAAIAKVRGYDIDRPSVRSAVLLSLVGSDADEILRRAGTSGGTLAGVAASRLPGSAILAINKGVGFRLMTQFGRKALGRLGRGVPFVGGVVGAGMDGYLLNRMAEHVRAQFPAIQEGEVTSVTTAGEVAQAEIEGTPAAEQSHKATVEVDEQGEPDRG